MNKKQKKSHGVADLLHPSQVLSTSQSRTTSAAVFTWFVNTELIIRKLRQCYNNPTKGSESNSSTNLVGLKFYENCYAVDEMENVSWYEHMEHLALAWDIQDWMSGFHVYGLLTEQDDRQKLFYFVYIQLSQNVRLPWSSLYYSVRLTAFPINHKPTAVYMKLNCLHAIFIKFYIVAYLWEYGI